MFIKPSMYLSVWKVKDECCCDVLMQWHFIPGVIAGGIWKTNTYTFAMLLPFEVWSYVLDVMKITPLTETCILSQTDRISFPPPSESLLFFHENPLLFVHCSGTSKKNQRTSLFLIAAPTVIGIKQNNWKLLDHMKYWMISLLADVLCTSELICFLVIDRYYWQQKTAVGCQLELEISWKLW